MKFYKLEGTVQDEKWKTICADRSLRNEWIGTVAGHTGMFNIALREGGLTGKRDEGFICVWDIMPRDAGLRIAVIDQGLKELNLSIGTFLREIEVDLRNWKLEEVTVHHLKDMLFNAERNGFIEDKDEILEQFGLDDLFGYRRAFGENILEEASREKVFSEAGHFMMEDTLIPELERIYADARPGKTKGHPVHYVIETDDRDTRRETYRLLLSALYANGRIRNKRYCFIDLEQDTEMPESFMEALYRSNAGGALIIRIDAEEEPESNLAKPIRNTAETVCTMMRRYRNSVLTILGFPRECTNLKEMFFEKPGSISLIEIVEAPVYSDRAREYLKKMARENGIRPDRKLYAKVEEGRGYMTPDLQSLFEEWYDRKLKTVLYPQYKEVKALKNEMRKEKPKGSAYEELMELIGLSEAKKVISQALAYYKAQKLYREKGLKEDRPSMHMVFTGNPGSAKTTVARLFARIMMDNQLLSRGHLVEVGRADLVGKYVGWTAPTIQRRFEEAKGGVLFIDEAYSLTDDRDGSYGDEAINTIVQEMENHRTDVVVIFAGYPEKMEKFLQKNPGLRSRIAFHVPFRDYSPEELLQISELMSGKKGFRLSDEARDKLLHQFENAVGEPDFGNGRYVRNVLEKARMAQAVRLISMDYEAVSRNDIETILPEDIDEPDVPKAPKKQRIGFGAA